MTTKMGFAVKELFSCPSRAWDVASSFLNTFIVNVLLVAKGDELEAYNSLEVPLFCPCKTKYTLSEISYYRTYKNTHCIY